MTISLGIRQIGASDRAELGSRRTASDRDALHDTRANGPPMARGLMEVEVACLAAAFHNYP